MVAKVKKVTRGRKAKHKTDKRLSKANYEFDVYSDRWRLDANLSLDFSRLDSLNIAPQFEKNFRLALADYACEFSSSYTYALFGFSRNLFALGVTVNLGEEHIINFKATLSKSTEYKLGYIRAFLLDWYDKGFKGVDKKTVDLLNSLILSGNETGKAVAIGCPYSGAYNFDEQVAFINWYVDAYTEKLISLTDYAFIMALQQTGARPIQLTHLYCGDLVKQTVNNIDHFDLKLPNAKKRKESFRGSFSLKEDVSEDLMLVLTAQAKLSIKKVEEHFRVHLDTGQRQTIPLFIAESALSDCDSFEEFLQKMRTTPDLFCLRSGSAAYLVKRLARLCPLTTSRIMIDGQPGDLHISPRRFRYTHATNMAIQGASDIAIAQELTHSSTAYVGVYTEFKEEIADRIDEALAPSLVPLAQAFSGTLIDSEKDAIRANDPRSRINNDTEAVGNCGKFGFCANGAIHCYTCNKFQPWLNAPHEKVLESVQAERDHKQKLGASEFVLQGQNRSIEAIKIVIQRCEERKEELSKDGALNV